MRGGGWCGGGARMVCLLRTAGVGVAAERGVAWGWGGLCEGGACMMCLQHTVAVGAAVGRAPGHSPTSPTHARRAQERGVQGDDEQGRDCG